MKSILTATIAVLAALSLAGCAGKGPVPIGKGKGVPPAPPPVVTKG